MGISAEDIKRILLHHNGETQFLKTHAGVNKVSRSEFEHRMIHSMKTSLRSEIMWSFIYVMRKHCE